MPPESPARLSGISKGARMVRMRSRSRFRCALLAVVAASTLAPAAPVLAQDQRRAEYRIEAGDLGEALKAVSRQSGKEIIFTSEAVLGHKAPALQGTYSADEAVRALLIGSGLVAQYRKNVIIIRGRSKPSGDLADRSANKRTSLLRVHGSRARLRPLRSQLVREMKLKGRAQRISAATSGSCRKISMVARTLVSRVAEPRATTTM